MSERRGYYTDTTDEQWSLIEPVITAWKVQHPSVSGHSGRYEMRAIVDAIFYQNRSGCQWSLLPKDFPVVVRNSATSVDQDFYAVSSYSLIRPPRTRFRRIRSVWAGNGITVGLSSGARRPIPSPW